MKVDVATLIEAVVGFMFGGNQAAIIKVSNEKGNGFFERAFDVFKPSFPTISNNRYFLAE